MYRTVILLCLVGLSACADKADKRDFFECGSGNTLVSCPVGQTPDPATYGDCRAVGSGNTTMADGVCS